jgi:ParB/RepB/Spo0J family partition protein
MALVKAKSKKRSKRNEEQPESLAVEKIAVADVEVTGKHREFDPDKAKSLAASMAKIGLHTPVTVRRITKGFGQQVLTLVAGLVRLKAAKTLGWEYIDAFVMEGTATDARRWQLMENLYRGDLTALQRAEHVAELVQGVLKDAKEVQLAPPGGQQPRDRGIKKAVKELGFTRDEIRRSLDIAGISEEAKTKAKELGLDHNQSALVKIAKGDGTDAQLGIIEEINSGKTSGSKSADKPNPKKKKSNKGASGDASGTEEQEQEDEQAQEQQQEEDQEEVASPSLSPEVNEDADSEPEETDNLDDSAGKDRLFAELKGAWDKAPKPVRKSFVKKVLRLDPSVISEEVWAL